MANNYCESSTILKIPPEKRAQAQEILDRVLQEMEDDDYGEYGFLGCEVMMVDEGVWFSHDESIIMEHVEEIARPLIEELDLPHFIAEWAFTCSKPRVDEFSGGGMLIKKGYETVWLHPVATLENMARTGLGLIPLEE